RHNSWQNGHRREWRQIRLTADSSIISGLPAVYLGLFGGHQTAVKSQYAPDLSPVGSQVQFKDQIIGIDTADMHLINRVVTVQISQQLMVLAEIIHPRHHNHLSGSFPLIAYRVTLGQKNRDLIRNLTQYSQHIFALGA